MREVFDGLGVLRGTVEPMQRFYGSFTFDAQALNTAPGTDVGQRGLYHHDTAPSGLRVRVGEIAFQSGLDEIDFDVIVNNDFGIVGADE